MSQRRGRLPRAFFFTDNRLNDQQAIAVINRLPRSIGIIHRVQARGQQLTDRIRKRHLFWLGRLYDRFSQGHHYSLKDLKSLKKMRAAFPRKAFLSIAVHDRYEIIQALKCNPDLVFLSPVFMTRSHPGRPALGSVRAGLELRFIRNRCPRVAVYALGGIGKRHRGLLKTLGFSGYGAIDLFC